VEGNQEMKAYTIIRVSAEDQLKGYGPDVQWYEDVIPAAPKLGLEVDEVYKRIIQESATTWDRPKFEVLVREAMALHKQGLIDAIAFPRVDRETRFVFGSLPLLSEVVQSGIKVFFCREQLQVDPNDSESVEKYLSKATQAQAYVETMKINTSRGRKRRVIQKKLLPSGRGILYGYDYDRDTGKNIANKSLDTVRMMGLWVLNEGIFLNEVCRRLQSMSIPAPKGGRLWSRGTVGRLLRNPTYAGKNYAYKTVTVDGKRVIQPQEKWLEVREDLVDKQGFSWNEWQEIQAQLDKNRELHPRHQKLHYLLRGRIICKRCGRRYYGVPFHGQPYYRCSGHNRLLSPIPCDSKSRNAVELENAVWAEIQGVLSDPATVLKELQSQMEGGTNTLQLEERLEQIDKQLTYLDEAQDKYLRMYGFGFYTFEKLEKAVKQARADEDKLKSEKAEIEKRLDDSRKALWDEKQVKAFLEAVAPAIANADYEMKEMAMQMLDIQVIVDSDTVNIGGRIPITELNIPSPQS